MSLQKHGINNDRLVGIGIYANGLIPIVLIPIAISQAMPLQQYLSANYFLVGFGVVIGPLWAWMFATIYRFLRRDFYATSL